MSLVGRQIGRYRILEQLGQGGMSVVYKGLDTALDREVAVKVLHPHLSTKPESRKRLDREARAVARLHHPNILEVYDFSGADSAEAFIVTEYIRGKTLREFISAEPLSPPEIAAMVMHEIAGALAHAHDQSVLHRDLKPENVMVRDDGVIKLTDFGIAKILDRDEKMTMTGALVGSPAHMAPEIIEGEESGAEADVFSLGTMLYLFVTGKLPFTAPNTTATLKRILDCVYEDPRQSSPTCSDELTEIIGRCLQRAPGERYATAGKLRDALAGYLSELGLTRPHEELPKFFLDPKGYRKDVEQRIIGTLLERAQKLIAEKRSARALSCLNQVLAHDPTNERATLLLDAMKAKKLREQRTKRLLRLTAAGGTAFIIGMAALKGAQIATRAPEPPIVLPFGPHDVVLTSVRWSPLRVEPLVEPDAGVAELIDAGTAGSADAGPALAVVKPRNGTPVIVKPPEKRPDQPQVTPPAAAIEVQVMVRPFGFLAIDGEPRSADALAMHRLKLSPGDHRFTVTCDDCEASGITRTVSIAPGQEAISLVAPLKPSLLSFDGFPSEAIVQVGAETRTVAESMSSPFRITTPPEGRRAMLHDVKYSVTLQGATLAQDVARVQPGKLLVVRRAP
ncbi:MAG: serine/threonine protein kinase [Myxococcaceae bacterium]|nr:serine/threonine protein kinase [Myxococcaceae bacterium]